MGIGGTAISQYGTCELTLSRNDQEVKTVFYAVQTDGPVIIGLPTCRHLGLVTLNYSIAARYGTSNSKVCTPWLVTLKPRRNFYMNTKMFSVV